MSAHTPGPWTEPRIYKDRNDKVYACKIYADGRTICAVDTRDGRGGEFEVNARLISAAPELVALVERASALMPLGTKIRADWMSDAARVLTKVWMRP